MNTKYNAQLVCYSDFQHDSDGNSFRTHTIAIYNDGVAEKFISVDVDSNADSIGYNNAVANAIGSHDFKWIN